MSKVELRDTRETDLPILFAYQQDPDANHMAAFTPTNPGDREGFMARWAMRMADETIVNKTILYGEAVVGHISRFLLLGDPAVGYLIGKPHWGKGIATRALALFLAQVPERPLYARVAHDNAGSIRVLEKCGFQLCGQDKFFANARGTEIEELIMKLEA